MALHKHLIGDKTEAAKWMPYALARLSALKAQGGAVSSVFVPKPGISIVVRVFSGEEHIQIQAKTTAPTGIFLCRPASDTAPDGWGMPLTTENAPLGTIGGDYPYVSFDWNATTLAWTIKRFRGNNAGNIDWKSSDVSIPAITWTGPPTRYFVWGRTENSHPGETALSWPKSTSIYAENKEIAIAPAYVIGAAVAVIDTAWRLQVLCYDSATSVKYYYADIPNARFGSKITGAYDAESNPTGWNLGATLSLDGADYATPWFWSANGMKAACVRRLATDLPVNLGKERQIQQIDATVGGSASVSNLGNYSLSSTYVPDSDAWEYGEFTVSQECDAGYIYYIRNFTYTIEQEHTSVSGPYTIAVDWDGNTLDRLDVNIDYKAPISSGARAYGVFTGTMGRKCECDGISEWNCVDYSFCPGEQGGLGVIHAEEYWYSNTSNMTLTLDGVTYTIYEHYQKTHKTSDYYRPSCGFGITNPRVYLSESTASENLSTRLRLHNVDIRSGVMIGTDVHRDFDTSTEDLYGMMQVDSADQCSAEEIDYSAWPIRSQMLFMVEEVAVGSATERGGKSFCSVAYSFGDYCSYLTDGDPSTLTEITGTNQRFYPVYLIQGPQV